MGSRLAFFVEEGNEVKRDESHAEAEVSAFRAGIAVGDLEKVGRKKVIAPVERERECRKQATFDPAPDHVKRDDADVERHLPGGNGEAHCPQVEQTFHKNPQSSIRIPYLLERAIVVPPGIGPRVTLEFQGRTKTSVI